MPHRTKNPWVMETYFQRQLEESIHNFGTTKDHAERQYWQGYGTAMKTALQFLRERFDHENTFN